MPASSDGGAGSWTEAAAGGSFRGVSTGAFSSSGSGSGRGTAASSSGGSERGRGRGAFSSSGSGRGRGAAVGRPLRTQQSAMAQSAAHSSKRSSSRGRYASATWPRASKTCAAVASTSNNTATSLGTIRDMARSSPRAAMQSKCSGVEPSARLAEAARGCFASRARSILSVAIGGEMAQSWCRGKSPDSGSACAAPAPWCSSKTSKHRATRCVRTSSQAPKSASSTGSHSTGVRAALPRCRVAAAAASGAAETSASSSRAAPPPMRLRLACAARWSGESSD
mmetsp:Transcript_10251/g.36117  ORF Transcript_10251/g.36117 Transcript_10251/m.36117 type:complete len:281 (+) Transcript_10251:135-977(+)